MSGSALLRYPRAVEMIEVRLLSMANTSRPLTAQFLACAHGVKSRPANGVCAVVPQVTAALRNMPSKWRIPSAPLRTAPVPCLTAKFEDAPLLASSWPHILTLTLLLLLLLHPKFDVAAAPLKTRQPQDCLTHWILRVRIDEAGAKANRIVTLRLVESSADFLHSSERLGSGRRQHGPTMLPPCFYQGSVEGEQGLAVAKQRDGLISASFHFGGRAYEIPEQPAQSAAPLSASRMPPSTHKRTCGVAAKESSATASLPLHADALKQQRAAHERHRRALKLDANSSSTGASRKYIQLILIGDQKFYEKQGGNMRRATERLWEIGNYVNGIYKQLGVNVITVHTNTWRTDPYTLTSANNPAGVNTTELLYHFMQYRMRELHFVTHTAAHLVSGLKFAAAHGDLGLAFVGDLCTFSKGGGVNSDIKSSLGCISTTIAHELGHNLGMEHDSASCACPDPQGCIMSISGSDVDPVQFSKCSIEHYLEYSVSAGLGYCMSDPPPNLPIGVSARCGNRVVDDGEDCDCGPAAWCLNKCCNPTTCKFNTGAKCASGECCNRATCTLLAQGTECRPSRGSCDLPEYCNGSSEWCPQVDDYRVDGTECLTGKAYCYKGRCNDRDSRCVDIFKDAIAAPASWAVATKSGTNLGYCSYSESDYTKLSNITYEYTACSDANQRCGLLYCVGTSGSSKTLRHWMGMGGAFSATFSDTKGGVNITNASFVQHDLKYSGYRDPGLVPNGAECGANMMCVDSKCVPATPSVKCPNCNGRGHCAQSGLCFCQKGYRPPDCLQPGIGGSTINRMKDDSTKAKDDSPRAALPSGGAVSWWLLSVTQLLLLLKSANGHNL